MKKLFKVQEALHPVANSIYTPSYDLVSVDNPTHRYIVEPGVFQLGETITEDEFYLENRRYTDGEEEIAGEFAVRRRKRYLLHVTVEVLVESLSPVKDILDEFHDNASYNFESTKNVKVIETSIRGVSRSF